MTCWGRIWLKGDEKWGKCIVFPQLVTKNLQNCKKKIACGALPLNLIISFIWGKNINQEGGGKIWISNLIYTPLQPNEALKNVGNVEFYTFIHITKFYNQPSQVEILFAIIAL